MTAASFLLFVDGQQVAEGRVGKTQPAVFSADEIAWAGSPASKEFMKNRHIAMFIASVLVVLAVAVPAESWTDVIPSAY